ncbi:helix-turn-helix domain-containing protein [Nonomuraea sp. NPDC049158]|uniref:PucR family transcriptional regulator n=1 Tax=Nonomuraea sp. NPDC049158 TaxID=3155649 RepID=UPI0033C6E679
MVAVKVPADLLGGHLDVLAEAAVTGRLPDRPVLDHYRAVGIEAAELGIPLRSLIDAALALESAGPEGSAAVLSALRRLVAALMEGYEQAQLAAIRGETSARREFVDDLLQGRSERLAERAEHFGLRLAGAYVVAVARGLKEGDQDRIERDLIARFGSHNILIAVREGLLVCVAPDTLPAALGEFAHHVRARFPAGWRIGVGRPQRGPGGVVTSFREAAGALDLADRLDLQPDVVKAADLLVFPVLLRDRTAMEDLVTSVLSPLLGARGGHEPLLETLEAIFASHGNQTAAARRMDISPRAITYRLERIRRLTGFSPDDPTQRFTLETAVLGARLLDWPWP